jgi:hypothetical protein
MEQQDSPLLELLLLQLPWASIILAPPTAERKNAAGLEPYSAELEHLAD